ncbi:MAG TPA: hypothetical protein PLU72_08275 [Candidatus Ozemobacteraceae bacterium]|nr:hypothetical protein [Candidatus Ozemobacteraceae bacterium]
MARKGKIESRIGDDSPAAAVEKAARSPAGSCQGHRRSGSIEQFGEPRANHLGGCGNSDHDAQHETVKREPASLEMQQLRQGRQPAQSQET